MWVPFKAFAPEYGEVWRHGRRCGRNLAYLQRGNDAMHTATIQRPYQF